MAVQTIKQGATVTFMIKGMADALVELLDTPITEAKFIATYGNKPCKVLRLETYTELGDRDYEYYTVRFEDGTIFEAVSGYHLHDIPKK